MKTLKTVAAIALAFAAMTATADYMVYWEVDGATNLYPADADQNALAFKYATIKANPGSGDALHVYNSNGDTGYWRLYAKSDNTRSTGAAYSGLFDDSTTSFLVELWTDDRTRVGWQTYSWDTVKASILDADTPQMTGTATAFKATAFVPEPTSGLLVLLGMAALTLRRKGGVA